MSLIHITVVQQFSTLLSPERAAAAVGVTRSISVVTAVAADGILSNHYVLQLHPASCMGKAQRHHQSKSRQVQLPSAGTLTPPGVTLSRERAASG